VTRPDRPRRGYVRCLDPVLTARVTLDHANFLKLRTAFPDADSFPSRKPPLDSARYIKRVTSDIAPIPEAGRGASLDRPPSSSSYFSTRTAAKVHHRCNGVSNVVSGTRATCRDSRICEIRESRRGSNEKQARSRREAGLFATREKKRWHHGGTQQAHVTAVNDWDASRGFPQSPRVTPRARRVARAIATSSPGRGPTRRSIGP